MKKILLLSSLTIILLALTSCDWFTSPEELEPGRRDYVWTADTIKIPHTYLDRMWGYNETNVWAIGAAGEFNQTIWHYDGVIWKTDSVYRSINPISIYGFSPDDIWIGGLEGRIWHYDGNQWKEKLNLEPKSKWVYSGFNDIWGLAWNDLYAVGFLDSNEVRYSIMFHYNGYEWRRKNISPEPGADYLRIKRGNNDSNYYIQAWKTHPFDLDTTLIITYNNNQLETIYRGLLDNREASYVQLLSNHIYLSAYDGIYTFNGSLNCVLKIDFEDWGRAFYGRNEKDIFLAMRNGVTHYNGENFESIYSYNSRILLRDVVIFSNEVFMLLTDYDNNFNIIRKGVLPL